MLHYLSTCMELGSYCPVNKQGRILNLLNFARITRIPDALPYSEKDQKTIIEVLDSLIDCFNPFFRPLLPLLYHNTIRTGLRELLNPETQKLLRDNALLLIGVEMLNQQWLKNTIATFKKEKLPVILLKGAAFSESLYPGNTPRVGVDLDLLVTEDDFEAVCDLMSKTMNPVLLSTERVATHDRLFERIFAPKKGSRPTVEIHRGLTNPSIFNIEEKSLWAASRKHPAYNSDLVRILSPEDTLLHLAVHAFRDLDFCTHNILDAHEVWCQWQPEPEILLEKAEKWGAQKVLYYLLINCREVMETPVPETLLKILKPANISNSINQKILKSSIVNRAEHSSVDYRLLQMLSQLTFPDNFSNGVKFQLIYARTRVKDWLAARKNQQPPS